MRSAALIAFCVFLADRVTKIAVCQNMAPAQSVEVIPNVFHLTLVLNKGAAFGLFRNQTAFFVSIAIITVSFIAFFLFRYRDIDRAVYFGLALILGGALGNLIDRLFFGYVIDFFDFRVWPVFNVADASVTIGAALLIWRSLCIPSCSK